MEQVKEEKNDTTSKKEIKKEVKEKKNKEVEKLKEENLELKNKVSELEDKLIRNNAELINFKRRKEEETSRLLKYSNEDIAKDILPIIDNFERALSLNNDNAEINKFLDGFKIIYNGLSDILKKYDVSVIDPIDQEFDPTYHQAVLTDTIEEKENNTVLEVMQKGYMLKDKVIRPAMVKVNQK